MHFSPVDKQFTNYAATPSMSFPSTTSSLERTIDQGYLIHEFCLVNEKTFPGESV